MATVLLNRRNRTGFQLLTAGCGWKSKDGGPRNWELEPDRRLAQGLGVSSQSMKSDPPKLDGTLMTPLAE
jgi:hypothetical protein